MSNIIHFKSKSLKESMPKHYELYLDIGILINEYIEKGVALEDIYLVITKNGNGVLSMIAEEAEEGSNG